MENTGEVIIMVKTNRKYLAIISTLLTFIILMGFLGLRDIYKNREAYSNNLIRLHVIANSDSPEDQDLKEKVRDRIIGEIHNRFDTSQLSIKESRELIKESLDEIEYIAKEEIKDLGKDYDVKVLFGKHVFPTKNYGAITLPAGEYESVRVVIGNGVGENWWCVMFPPLCFIDITNGITDTRTKDELRKVLTEEEFNMILASRSEEQTPIRLKFKVVEMIESSRLRFANIFVSQK